MNIFRSLQRRYQTWSTTSKLKDMGVSNPQLDNRRRNNLLTDIQQFSHANLNMTPARPIERTAERFRQLGAVRPEPGNMTRNVMLSQIETFNQSQLKPIPDRPIERTVKRYRQLGVQHPEPQNMNRNVMLSQIETFDRKRLKPLTPEQRYIVSPHDDIRNLFNNARGMGQLAMSNDLPAIRPVFKNEQQREAFHQRSLGYQSDLDETSSETSRKIATQLVDWSKPENAMLDFSSVSTKRSHPIVYTQGHGSPGTTSISSDSHESTTGGDVASLLQTMGIPNVSEIRANSCHSGTEVRLQETMPSMEQHFKEGSVDVHHAGRWQQTFAGTLESSLRASSHKGRVRGYLGPTSQGALPVKTRGLGGKLEDTTAMRVRIDTLRYKRSDMKRYSPIKG